MTSYPLMMILATLLMGGAAANAMAGACFAVFSDPHYYDGNLGTSGADFEAYLALDRKLLRESAALAGAVVDAIITENRNAPIDFVMVPGDLTKDGELESHEEFSEYLEHLQNDPQGP